MSRYTILIVDNEKNNPDMEFEVNTFEFNMTKDRLRMIAELPPLAELEEKEEITEKLYDCRFGCSFVDSTGFSSIVQYCEVCGTVKSVK